MYMTKMHGVIEHPNGRKTDYLYRVSVKGIVRNEAGEVLLVKEAGRDWWDLPGGGMDHGEDIKTAISREMKEEVNLTGDFTYRIVHVSEPILLQDINMFLLCLYFVIHPKNMQFSPGEDADEVRFMSLEDLREIDSSRADRIQVILNAADAATIRGV